MKRFLISLLALAAPAALAQSAPVPPQIFSAHTVFVSNAGSDSGLFPHPFSGDPSRGYDELYAGLQSMNLFQLVDTPEQADLVLQIQLIAPTGSLSNNKEVGVADPLPTFKLTIYDRPSHYILWTFAEPVNPAVKQKTHDENYEDAMRRLLGDVQQLVPPQPPPPVSRGTGKPGK